MHAERTILEDLAVVLLVAGGTSLFFRWLRQPVLLGYILAGLIVSPHTPLPLFADVARIRTLSELGVTLVMFSIGLEFSVRRLLQVVPTAGPVALLEISVMILLGQAAGRIAGWSALESLFCGAMLAISSTMIIAKVFRDQRVGGRLSELVLGVLVVQDLAAILLITLLTSVASGGEVPAREVLRTAAELAVFLALTIIVGFLVVPRTIRRIDRFKDRETLLIASMGVCFGMALLAYSFGYSVALGAFIAGALIAESGLGEKVEQLVRPVRDVFAAIFFVSVGMMVDPVEIARHPSAVLALTAIVVIGQPLVVSAAGFLSGAGLTTSVRAGMSLAQIGEFSFIIAGIGVSTGAVGRFLFPVAVAVGILTSFLTPYLVKRSEAVSHALDRRLPKPLQTFTSLYESWLEEVRAGRRRRGASSRTRRLLRLVMVDAICIVAVVVGAVLFEDRLLAVLDVREPLARWLFAGLVLVSTLPFWIGLVRCARGLGGAIVGAMFPETGESQDRLVARPRRALVVTAQIAVLLAVGLPLVALVQPLIPFFFGPFLLLALAILFVAGLWRASTELQDNVQAGAQVIADLLAKQGGPPRSDSATGHASSLFPGLGHVLTYEVEEASGAVGRTLAELNLRNVTGATVIAIRRSKDGVVAPTGREALAPGDALYMVGTHEALDHARRILGAPLVAETPLV